MIEEEYTQPIRPNGMQTASEIVISVRGIVDMHNGKEIASKVRAAISNEAECIVLEFEEQSRISSAEFMGFLVTAAKYQRERQRALRLRGIEGFNKELFRIARLEHVLEKQSVDS